MSLRIWLPLSVALAVTASHAAAEAVDATLGWSTYLRAGPSQASAALDELSHDVPVRVLGCDDRWCRVDDGALRGYVDRDALRLPRVPAPDASALGHCTLARLDDAPGGAPTRMCDGARR